MKYSANIQLPMQSGIQISGGLAANFGERQSGVVQGRPYPHVAFSIETGGFANYAARQFRMTRRSRIH